MKKKIHFLLLCLLLSIGYAAGQTMKVGGRVISAEDHEPVIGASLIVKGTTIGTITNEQGVFSLEVPADTKVLLVSYVGMVAQEVPVQPTMEIVLGADVRALNEVVVTAMGLTRESKSLGYAIQEVDSEELTQAGQMNLTSSLTGKIAGVQVNQFGGTVGASSRISIRGNSSLSADQQPLIVVDGVPISNDTNRSGDNYYTGVDYGSGLNDINAEDIESITVLKGGSAALYGMRAGSGVLLVTTKKGKGAKGVKISYDGSFTFDMASTLPKLQNSYGQGENGDEYHWKLNGAGLSYQEYALNNSFAWGGINTQIDESWGARLDAGLLIPQFDSGDELATPWISHPNNVKDFYQTGFSMNHTIAVQAQTDISSTRASISYRDQKGTVPNTDQRRYAGQITSLMKLNEQISFDLTASYTRTESDNLLAQGYSGSNPVNGIVNWAARQINMKSLKDNWDQKDGAGNYTFYNWNTSYHMNPYFNVHENTNGLQRDRFFTKVSLFYQPIESLKIEGRLGFDHYNTQTFEKHYMDYSDYPDGGLLRETTKNSELNLDLLATFNKRFGDFNISAMAGANYRDVNWQFNRLGASSLVVKGVYTLSNLKGSAITLLDNQRQRSNSIFASASVGWRDQLYLDMSARNDWSSTIKDPFFYPSVSLSWLATESFPSMKGDVLSFLKLRGGWAEIGKATSPYRNRAYYYSVGSNFNGVPQMYKSATYPNPGLKPESIRTWEVGLEAGFFDDRLHFDLAYYYKDTRDQILSVTTSNVIGYSSRLLNAGKITNKGVELQMKGEILSNKNGFNWLSTLNFSKDKSKIVELYPQANLRTYQMGWTWGVSNLAKEGETWGVLSAEGFDRTPDGAIKVNENGLPMIVAGADIGHVTPDFLMGWRNDFSYKDFSFGFFMDLRLGGDIWSQTMSHAYYAGTASVTAKDGIRERLIVPGKDVMTNERFVMQNERGEWVPNTIEVSAQDWFKKNEVAEMYVFDGSYLKLREAYITYNVPAHVLKKWKYFSRASISLVGSNLALLWVHKSNTMRIDPETGGVSSDSRGVGFEQSAVPSSRSIGIKLGLTF